MNTKVSNHFSSLIMEIEGVIETINKEGAKAFEDGDYSKAKEFMDKGLDLKNLRGELSALQVKWLKYGGSKAPEKQKILKWKKTPRGLRTHEDEYRIPILQALVELGGTSNLRPVIDRVGEIMKPILNKHDYMALKSDPKTPKWRNTTQWVRWHLVEEGLMADDSPTGTWEITSKGRKWLEENT
jgi:restriction system protein